MRLSSNGHRWTPQTAAGMMVTVVRSQWLGAADGNICHIRRPCLSQSHSRASCPPTPRCVGRSSREPRVETKVSRKRVYGRLSQSFSDERSASEATILRDALLLSRSCGTIVRSCIVGVCQEMNDSMPRRTPGALRSRFCRSRALILGKQSHPFADDIADDPPTPYSIFQQSAPLSHTGCS